MSFAVRAAIVWLLTTGFLVIGGAEAGPTIGLPLILVGLLALLQWRDSRPLPPEPPPQPVRWGPIDSLARDANPTCVFCKGSGRYNLGGGRETTCGCVTTSRRIDRQLGREAMRVDRQFRRESRRYRRRSWL